MLQPAECNAAKKKRNSNEGAWTNIAMKKSRSEKQIELPPERTKKKRPLKGRFHRPTKHTDEREKTADK